jgi:Pyrimidine 5'-nucleotidase (UMPH-1)
MATIPRLSTEFEADRSALFERYYPYEVDPNLSNEKRDYWMQEWWREAIGLHKRYALEISDLENIDYNRSVIRDGW